MAKMLSRKEITPLRGLEMKFKFMPREIDMLECLKSEKGNYEKSHKNCFVY